MADDVTDPVPENTVGVTEPGAPDTDLAPVEAGEIEPDLEPSYPEPEVPAHLRSAEALLAHVKTWIRRELMLKGAGHTEPERAKLNP